MTSRAPLSARLASILLSAGALLLAARAADANPFKDFGHAVKDGAKAGGKAVKQGAKELGRAVKGGFKGGVAGVKSGVRAGG